MVKHPGHKPGHKRPKLGPGLGLEAFACAKQSTYDLKAKKEKERALNAKTVNKYRKLQRRLQGQQQPRASPPGVADEEAEPRGGPAAAAPAGREGTAGAAGAPPAAGGEPAAGKRRHHRPVPHLQRVAAKVQAQKAEEQAAREAQQRERQERQAAQAARQRERAQRAKQMAKRTARGQPVMRFRLDKVLQQLGS